MRIATAYLRALFDRRPRLLPAGAPGPALEVDAGEQLVTAAALARYREVCQLEDDGVPITFPQVLAAPVHLRMITGSGFPLRAMGLVHLSNRIAQQRPLEPGASYRLRCALHGYQEEERGQVFDLRSEFSDAQGPCWSASTRFMARRPRSGPKPVPEPSAPLGAERARFEVAGDTGRRYAPVSGDYNPIHLYRWSARLFGFPRAIAHGMWAAARSLGLLGLATPGAAVLELAFKTPLLLPSTVVLNAEEAGGETRFALYAADDGRPHLVASLSPGAAP